jgi:hypothetical protein
MLETAKAEREKEGQEIEMIDEADQDLLEIEEIDHQRDTETGMIQDQIETKDQKDMIVETTTTIEGRKEEIPQGEEGIEITTKETIPEINNNLEKDQIRTKADKEEDSTDPMRDTIKAMRMVL